MRRKAREIQVGKIKIGGSSPIFVQSMTTTKTADVEATIAQIHKLEKIGCEIIRSAVTDDAALAKIPELMKNINIPFIADIHFNHKLAIKSLEMGADCVRINPGNLGGIEKFKQVIICAKQNKKALRIGVNAGSLEKKLLEKYKHPTSDALVESAISYVKICEQEDFTNLKLSVKSSNVMDSIEAYRKLSKACDYPLHIGITEAGTRFSGSIRSAVGLGILLSQGIGDTLRVSLSGDPSWEVVAGFEILKSLGLREKGLTVISCPTCGRCNIPVNEIAEEIEQELFNIKKSLTVAVMGCAVNGPGEAKEADIGIAGGEGSGVFFRKGKVVRKIDIKDIKKVLIEEIQSTKFK